jgi:hypothetical protein
MSRRRFALVLLSGACCGGDPTAGGSRATAQSATPPAPSAASSPAAPPPVERHGAWPPEGTHDPQNPFLADRAAWVDFVTRAAAPKNVARAEVEAALAARPHEAHDNEKPTGWDVFCARLGFDPADGLDGLCWNGATHYVSLYVADADNDGDDDFVLAATNLVASHNDWVLGAYEKQGAGLSPIKFGGPPAFADQTILHFGRPFFRRDPEGITFSLVAIEFRDAKGEIVELNAPGAAPVARKASTERWIWKGGGAKLLETTVEEEDLRRKKKTRRVVKGAAP